MPILNTPRAGRNMEGYMENLIENMYTNENAIYRQGYGVCAISPEAVIDSYHYVRNTYGKNNSVKVHYIEIYMEKEFGIEATLGIADIFGRYLYGQGFQVFISTLRLENYYLITVAVNAVSYIDGRAFHDNNMQYANIYYFLKTNMQCDWEITVEDNIFFNPKRRNGNYVHGKLL